MTPRPALTPAQDAAKRALDLVLAVLLLGLTWWVIALAWVGATLSTGCNGFFLQERIGRWGRPFKVIKLRTMRPDPAVRTHVTTLGDPRITRFGAWMRRWKVDELPQLVNVLLGQMSFVGPRPDVPGFADRLEGEARAVLSLRAGITGPATLRFRHEEELLAAQADPEGYNLEVIWPEKVRLNLDYIRTYSLAKDLKFILWTALGR